ncbi:MAG: MarR family winged helix-turn-helix transcriptional regulator [Alphaproteobacteria bacterium]|nr:MarR family winged helix-turn-helix transcriptional regulator [Alphaproteobacteria bacterium]
MRGSAAQQVYFLPIQGGQRVEGPTLGPLADDIAYQVRQVQSVIFRDQQIALDQLEATPGEFGVLTLIEVNPGISQVDLAGLCRLDTSTLSAVVTRVVRRGLVRRWKSREDARCSTLWLSRPGTALLRRMRLCMEERRQLMETVLQPGERRQLLDILGRISVALER